MSKQKPIEPRWLVSLLVCWARRDLHDEIRGLGYYSINPMLKDGIPGRVRSYEPAGYSGQDYTDLEQCLKQLKPRQLLAVLRYCKPWKAADIDAEYRLDADTWMHHLRNGMEALARLMDDRNPKVVAY